MIRREGDRAIRADTARCLAARIADAQLAMLQSEDHCFWHGDTQAVLDATERFRARSLSGIGLTTLGS